MPTVPEIELRQKISEFIAYAKEYAANLDKDFTLKNKREGFKFTIRDKEIALEFVYE